MILETGAPSKPESCVPGAAAGSGADAVLPAAELRVGPPPSFEASAAELCPGCDGSGVTTTPKSAEVLVPPGVADGERLPVGEGSREVVVVRVLAAPPDYAVVRYVAALGLLVAIVFLWLLLR
jgi:hypothetical protein